MNRLAYHAKAVVISIEYRVALEHAFPTAFEDYCAGVARGIDNPMVNPVITGAPSLVGLACSRLLVNVAEKDLLRDRGILYCSKVKGCGWKGETELIQVAGEDHAFQILVYEFENAKKLIKRLASFLV
ncbi:hypothetical protein DITRI_Ditri15bG0075100 [Diplodiscus trichospermus]